MERWFFEVLVHLVVSLNLGSADTVRLKNSAEVASMPGQKFGTGPIHLQLRAETGNRDLAIRLKTITDVKNLASLIHAIVINHPEDIGLSEVNDKTKENHYAADSFQESRDQEEEEKEEEDWIDSQATTYRDNENQSELETRRELLRVTNNLRMQSETLNTLSQRFNNVLRKVLTAILMDLKRPSKKKRTHEISSRQEDEDSKLLRAKKKHQDPKYVNGNPEILRNGTSTTKPSSPVNEQDIPNTITNSANLKSNRVEFSNKNSDTNAKINNGSNLSSIFRAWKNSSRERNIVGAPDIGSTMRFGSDEMFKASPHKKSNETAKLLRKKFKLQDKSVYEKSKESVSPFVETLKKITRAGELSKKLLDESLTTDVGLKRSKKKYVMDVILESINAVIKDNGTKLTVPMRHEKTLR